MTTEQVTGYLSIKKVYTLVAEKGLPATKITGKWMFPKHLVDQWIENHTTNYPENRIKLPSYEGLLIIAGSNDPLLEQAMIFFNAEPVRHLAVFGNIGSMGGLQALRLNKCHLAACHLICEDEHEYNFEHAYRELDTMPALVNFCRREQGILVPKGNPAKIEAITDLVKPGVKIINRPIGTGTRLLLDQELIKAGLSGTKINGYNSQVGSHVGVGLEILSGRVSAGIAVRAVAVMLALDFISLRWERYDFMISRERFFDEGVQRFLSLLHAAELQEAAKVMGGYDLTYAGEMIFPREELK